MKRIKMRRITSVLACAAMMIALSSTVCFPDAPADAAGNPGEETEIVSSDLMIRLNRSELEGLGEIDGPIYVFGHQSPDSDAVCTSIVYAYILRELGYDARPVTLGQINHETEFILESAGADIPPILDDAAGKNVVLVDHSEYSQSAEGLKDANVLMIIDHHGDGSVTTGHQLIYDSRPLGSTATITWIRAMNYGVELDQQSCLLLLGAVLSDTSNFKSEKTTEADREVARVLAQKAGIDDTDAFYQKMYAASLSYAGMTDEEILMSDLKKYETEGTAYVIGVVNCYSKEEAPAMAERMKAVMPEVLSSTGAEFGYAQISIFHDDISVCYIVPSDEKAVEVLETAFGDEGEWQGISYVVEPGFSRRSVFVPRLTEALSLHPQE